MGTNVSDPACASLFPRSRCAILGLLLAHPGRPFYLREIVKKTELGVGQVQRELARLHRGGIILRTERGRHVYFEANQASPIYEELRGLIMKTAGAVILLRRALAPLSNQIRSAFIFGSVARGEQRPDSDLDLMVIGETSFAEVVEAIRSAELAAGRPINPSVYRPAEFASKMGAGHHFLNAVGKGKKLFVIGTDCEFTELFEQ